MNTIVSQTTFGKGSQKPDYVKTHCSNDRKSSFHFACRKWIF